MNHSHIEIGRGAGLFVSVLAVVFLLTGCRSTEFVKPDPALNAQNAATLYIYRPSSDWFGLAIDFRVTAGRVALGSLASGDAIEAYLPAGTTIVRVQPHFLGFADGKPAEKQLTLAVGDRVYLRFAQSVDTVTPIGNTMIVTGGGNLTAVTAADYEARR